MDLYTTNPLILDIVMQLRAEYGIDTRPGAEAALAEWKHADQLTNRERDAVLARFPASQVVDLTFDEGGWLEEHLNDQHERLCALNAEDGAYSHDLAMIQAIIPKLA